VAAPVPGAPAREAAVRLLHAVLVLGQTLDGALPGAFRQLSDSADRALARALASEALRHLVGLDALIDSACRQPLPPDARARNVLRVALAARYRLGTPPHAVVATALPLVAGGPRRLVHGVLSTLLKAAPPLAPPVLPPPVARSWELAWGPDMVEAAAAEWAGQPAHDLRLADPEATAAWVVRLGGRSLFPGHVRLAGAPDVAALDGFSAGGWWVQDAAAQLPATLLRDVAGRRVLDCCAAPGGKTLQLAAAGAAVTALDVSETRLRRLSDNLARTGLRAEIVAADALDWTPHEPFDAIMLDAPCSASGTWRRHPDVLWRAGGRDLRAVTGLQRALLARAARWVRPGGRLLYAVCSLEPEEGEGIVVPPELRPDPVAAAELPDGLRPDREGAVRLVPGHWHPADGFYMRRFLRP
jgi:16S rRNA (cytosine967-C5)-methyltransferase